MSASQAFSSWRSTACARRLSTARTALSRAPALRVRSRRAVAGRSAGGAEHRDQPDDERPDQHDRRSHQPPVPRPRHVATPSPSAPAATLSGVRNGAADQALVTDVRRRLRAAGDATKGAQMRAYMKSALPFHGVNSPDCRVIMREVLAAHALPDRATWLATCSTLWDDASHREERYAALAVAKDRRYAGHRDPDVLPLYRHLVVTGAWWDLVDDVATHLVGPLLLAHPAGSARPWSAWATDEDRWLRRTAVICQVRGQGRTDVALLAMAVEANLDDRDFFLRKAIGWALRQHARTDPAWVRDFVDGPRRPAQRPVAPRGPQAPEPGVKPPPPRSSGPTSSPAWAIDPEILAAAPESPYGFPPEVFAAGQYASPSPLAELARAALGPGGLVLDVGAGAGAASLEIVPAGGHLHAVDSQPSMLRALEAAARDRGVSLTTYDGMWPDLADQVPVCDVAVCAHVVYNVPDLVPFATALTRQARDLVVVELTGTHPLTRLGPMWEAVHHQPRPDGPTAELAVAVLREAGPRAGGARAGHRAGRAHRRAAGHLGRLHPPPALPAAGAPGRGGGADAAPPAEAEAVGGALLARRRLRAPPRPVTRPVGGRCY